MKQKFIHLLSFLHTGVLSLIILLSLLLMHKNLINLIFTQILLECNCFRSIFPLSTYVMIDNFSLKRSKICIAHLKIVIP